MTIMDGSTRHSRSAAGLIVGDESATDGSGRRYDLDWLRIFAFGVLILYHVGMFYVTWDWYLKSRYSAPFLEPVMALTGGRLAVLFFISGVAVRFAIDKTTVRGFLAQRSTRLVVPLAAGMAVICAPQTYVELRDMGEIDPGYLAFYRDYLGFGDFSMTRPPWNHLWYVAYILVYSVFAAASLPLLKFTTDALGGPFFAWLARGRAWRLLLVPAIPLAVYTLALDPYFPTTLALWGDWAYIARTLTLFLLGFLAAKNENFWNAVDGALPAAIGLSLVLGGLVVAAFLNEFAVTADPNLFTGSLLIRVLYGWSMVVMLLGLARRFANRPSRTLTYLTTAILPYYILHQTITLIVSYWFTTHEVPVAIEATTIVLVTILGCVLGYEIIRRVALLRPLFGLPVAYPGRTGP